MPELTTACNAWHLDSLERLKSRIDEVLPLVKRLGPVYVCSPELATSISRSAITLEKAIDAFLAAAQNKSEEANHG